MGSGEGWGRGRGGGEGRTIVGKGNKDGSRCTGSVDGGKVIYDERTVIWVLQGACVYEQSALQGRKGICPLQMEKEGRMIAFTVLQ